MGDPSTKRMPGATMSLLDLSSPDLYANLGLTRTAALSVIKQAYYKLALQYHPDRNPECKAEFQIIGRAYEVLSDEAKRRVYDETGVVADEAVGEANFEAYFRALFQRVRSVDIDAFKATYVGSVEEYEDVLAAYRKRKGNLEALADDIFFGDDEGAIDRFAAIIRRAITKGIIDEERAFTKLGGDGLEKLKNKRKRTAQQEAREAEELARELGIGKDGANLHSIIKNRQKGGFDSMIAGLEAKYGDASKKYRKNKERD